jgi:hypothetical protein
MKLKVMFFLIVLWLSNIFFANAQSYDVLNYAYNGTPTHGIKIKTNIPYTNGSQMPNVRIEGYNYGLSRTIGVNLVWYIYDGNIIKYSASSFGGYTLPIKLSRENDKIVIFIDDRNYYNRFKVSVYATGMGESASWFSGWTTTDEPLVGSNTVDIAYTNSFAGNVGIGTSNPQTKLHVNTTMQVSPFTSGEYGGYMTDTDSRITILDGNIYDGVHGGISFGGMYVENGIRYQAIYNHINFGSGALRIKNNQQNKIIVGAGDEWGNQNVIINPDGGNLGVGTNNPTEKLSVNGNIRAKKLIVTQNGWPDYVFAKNYKLRPIHEVANFIATNKHLPDMPSAKDVEEKGLDIGKTQAALLKKIEELTLYIINLENRLSTIEKKK